MCISIIFIFSYFRLLIEYTEDKNNPDNVWKGYVYALAMLVTAIIHSILLQHFFHMMVTTGIRIRSTMIGLLYEKVRAMLHVSIRPPSLSYLLSVCSSVRLSFVHLSLLLLLLLLLLFKQYLFFTFVPGASAHRGSLCNLIRQTNKIYVAADRRGHTEKQICILINKTLIKK